MKSITLITLTLISLNVACQEKNNIKSIFEYCEGIDQNKSLISRTLQKEEFLEQLTSGESKMKVYTLKNQLQKIEVQLITKFQTDSMTFYFHENQLILADYVLSPVDPKATSVRFKGRYYYAQEVLFHYLEEGEWIFGNPANKRSSLILLDSKYYRRKAVAK